MSEQVIKNGRNGDEAVPGHCPGSDVGCCGRCVDEF